MLAARRRRRWRVASRDESRRARTRASTGSSAAHGSYEELLADPDVDAVYISLPNSMHVDWSVRALEAGKHVLCEKPLTRHPDEVERAFDAADAAGRVLMEAFMWRYTPQAAKLLELLPRLGELRVIRAHFSLPAARDPDNVRLERRAGRRIADGRRVLLRERRAAGRAAPSPRRSPGTQVMAATGSTSASPGRCASRAACSRTSTAA